MAHYRLYTLTKNGRIFGAADIIDADTDEDAVAMAKRLQNSLDVELWLEGRMVTRLSSGPNVATTRRDPAG